ncbi:MAG: alpha-amylase family glycosyl hydrolase, partial [Candidatus Sumerlaeota bacterium]
HATSVKVTGEFNSWSTTSNPLTYEGSNGMWSGVVLGAHAGQQYKYFIANTAAISPNSATAYRRDPYSRVLSSGGDPNSVIYDSSAFDWQNAPEFSTQPLNKTIIYELHIGSFNAPSGTPATFDQAILRLDSLVTLGVNAVEVMPLHDNTITNDWGYDSSLLYAIEQTYGGPDAFKRFVKACHERELAVIVDVVYNHAVNGSDLYDFDLWREGTGGGIWFFNDAANRDTPWGPRFNYTAPEVTNYLKNNVRMYLDEFRVDGFRFDATGIMRKKTSGVIPGAVELLREVTTIVNSEYLGKLCIAEDFDTDLLATKDINSGGLGFKSEWSDFYADLVRLLSVTDANRNLPAFSTALQKTYNGGAFKRIIYAESHDSAAPEDPPNQLVPYRGGYLPRRLNQTDPETNLTTCKLSMLGSTLGLTAPGIPMLFMGQEFYATSVFNFPSPPAINWSALQSAHGGIMQLHNDLISLRLNSGGSTSGLLGANVQVFHTNNGAKVIAFRRYGAGGPGDDVVVILNLSAASFGMGYLLGVPAAGTWFERFNSSLTTYDPRFATAPASIVPIVADATTRDGQPAQINIPNLTAYTAIILSQDPVGATPTPSPTAALPPSPTPVLDPTVTPSLVPSLSPIPTVAASPTASPSPVVTNNGPGWLIN